MFHDNKYKRIYFSIIKHAQIRGKAFIGYTEKHHIIPKSLGGTDDVTNIVTLTAREHFICHRLLVRMCILPKNKKSMRWALHRMVYQAAPRQNRYTPSSRVFEHIKLEFINAVKGKPRIITEQHRANIAAANTKRLKGKTLSAEWRAAMSKSHIGRTSPRKGTIMTDEQKQKISDAFKRKRENKQSNL